MRPPPPAPLSSRRVGRRIEKKLSLRKEKEENAYSHSSYFKQFSVFQRHKHMINLAIFFFILLANAFSVEG